jgi:hypothetical protein
MGMLEFKQQKCCAIMNDRPKLPLLKIKWIHSANTTAISEYILTRSTAELWIVKTTFRRSLLSPSMFRILPYSALQQFVYI